MKRTISLFFLAAFIFKTSVTAAQINVQDSLALVDIYNNDNGVNWPSYAQWNLSSPVSTWYNVTVTNNRVTTLD